MEAATAVEGSQIVIACGPPGVVILPKGSLQQFAGLQVAIDLNAVPPHGLGDVEPTDKATKRGDDRVLRGAGRRRHEDEDPQGGDREAVHREQLGARTRMRFTRWGRRL